MRFFSSKSSVYLMLLALFWFALAVICKITVGLGLIRYAGTDTVHDVISLLLSFYLFFSVFVFPLSFTSSRFFPSPTTLYPLISFALIFPPLKYRCYSFLSSFHFWLIVMLLVSYASLLYCVCDIPVESIMLRVIKTLITLLSSTGILRYLVL